MIKEIKRLLEVGEKAIPGDKFIHTVGNHNVPVVENVTFERIMGKSSAPHFRETLVLELPPIPEGFRLVTKEDKKNKLKGKLKFLSIEDNSTVSWEHAAIYCASDARSFFYIIKPKQKGFTIQDVKPGMTFILANTPYNVKSVCLDNFIDLEGFGQVKVEILNKHFHYLSGGKVGLCSEYEG